MGYFDFTVDSIQVLYISEFRKLVDRESTLLSPSPSPPLPAPGHAYRRVPEQHLKNWSVFVYIILKITSISKDRKTFFGFRFVFWNFWRRCCVRDVYINVYWWCQVWKIISMKFLRYLQLLCTRIWICMCVCAVVRWNPIRQLIGYEKKTFLSADTHILRRQIVMIYHLLPFHWILRKIEKKKTNFIRRYRLKMD